MPDSGFPRQKILPKMPRPFRDVKCEVCGETTKAGLMAEHLQKYCKSRENNVPDERLRAAEELKVRASECAENIRANCHATYNGGHREESSLEAFHHGMDTICNVLGNGQALAAFAIKERDSAMREAAGLVCERCAKGFKIDCTEDGRYIHGDFGNPYCTAALIHERLALKEKG
jgi:hypothetical protein